MVGKLTFGAVIMLACAISFWGGQHCGSGVNGAVETKPAKSAELTCSLSPDELRAQRNDLIPGLFRRAEKVEEIANGVRFRFAHAPKLVSEIAAVIEKEQVCCSFLSFRLLTEASEGPITLEVTGPGGTAEMLKNLAYSLRE